MTFDAHKNFAYGTVTAAPSPPSSGTSLSLGTGQGVLMPSPPFNATVWPTGSQPTASNAEIVRVTAVSGDVLTVVRAQEGSSARQVAVTDQFAATITAKTLGDIETAASAGGVSSFQGRSGAVTLSKGDVTGTGLAASDVGADASGAATAAQAAAVASSLQKSANLSDVANATTARTNLGLGTAATQASTAFDASGAATAAQAASLQKASNLSDLANATTARSNLGLGTAATQASSAFDAAGAATAAQTAAIAASDASGAAAAAQAASLQKSSNLSDLASASTARTNLGLGTAATQATGAFDASGAAAAAQTAAIAASAQALAPTAVKTANYTASAGDFVPCDVSGGAFTVTLPTAPVDKARIGVKVIAQAGTPNTLTVARGGSTDVFNKAGGSTSLSLSALFQGVLLQYAAGPGIWYVTALESPLGVANGAAQLDATSKVPSGQLPTAVVSGTADTLVTAKGDLAVGASSGVRGIVAVGSNGQVLTADSAQTDGVKWAAAASGPTVTSVAYSATITPAAPAGGAALVLNIAALTGNLTLANPTGTPTDGQNIRVRFIQDATGGRTITFGAQYAFGSDITANLIPTAASSKWEMLFTWNAADSTWRVVSLVRGF